MSEQILLRIEKKLDQMVKLLARSISLGKTQAAAIEILASAGLDRSLIAELLNTTPNTVSVTLSLTRSRRKMGRKQEAALPDETSTE